jgi:hypothetical protein
MSLPKTTKKYTNDRKVATNLLIFPLWSYRNTYRRFTLIRHIVVAIYSTILFIAPGAVILLSDQNPELNAYQILYKFLSKSAG